MINSEVISALKSFNWNEIIAKGNQLEDLNDRQWRFMKGLVSELIVEKYSGENGLKYVGADHKDFDWPHYDLTVELKGGLSGSMYGKKGRMKKTFSVKFNNSLGTNKKEKLESNEVADILLVIKNDGAFVADRDTVIKYSKKGGDGFEVELPRDSVTEITGKVTVNTDNNLNIRKLIQDAIKQAI